jgi:hypothetical protein
LNDTKERGEPYALSISLSLLSPLELMMGRRRRTPTSSALKALRLEWRWESMGAHVRVVIVKAKCPRELRGASECCAAQVISGAINTTT